MSSLEEQLQSALKNCDTREDFLKFIETFCEDLLRGDEAWSNKDLESFLRGLKQAAKNYEAYFDTAHEGAEAVHSVSWAHMAKMLSVTRFAVETKTKKQPSSSAPVIDQPIPVAVSPAPVEVKPIPEIQKPALVKAQPAAPRLELEPMEVKLELVEIPPEPVKVSAAPMGANATLVDLKSALPQLLPRIISWAEAEAAHHAKAGRRLNERERQFARKAGVLHTDRIRIVLVTELPMPEEPELRSAALQAGFLGTMLSGLTFGYTVFISRGHENARQLSHEFRRVYQYESAGSIAAFLPKFLEQILDRGYDATIYEIDARAHEQVSF